MTKAIDFLTELAARRRFGMKPGLKTITEICDRLGHPEREFKAVHIAGTNGKGTVAAILDSVFVGGRYTSPHLMRLNERFCRSKAQTCPRRLCGRWRTRLLCA
jgi:dihydrofolate synthase/folylpolyglutamate synthase